MKKKRYKNLNKITISNTFKDLLKWQKERRNNKKDLSFQMPISDEVDVEFLKSNHSIPTITWIGHATFLIQLNGKNILTDPVWAKRLGTYKRLSPPGVPINELPIIDYVLISHSHYDHLDYYSVKRLKGNPTFLVPVGLKGWFKRRGFNNVIELNWWEDYKVDELNFTFVPAQHWTMRVIIDRDRSHWGGWVIQDSHKHSIYFAGDTGYFEGFKEIGERFSIDYCLMPIGAYEPEWFMSPQHVSPEQAVKAFLDTKGHTMIPMHYGAYRLADDTANEALDRLLAEWKRRNLNNNNLNIMKIGETVNL